MTVMELLGTLLHELGKVQADGLEFFTCYALINYTCDDFLFIKFIRSCLNES